MPASSDKSPESLGEASTDLAGAVRAYFRAIDELRFDDAVALCSDEVVFALPPAGAAETAPRQVLVGRTAILERFAGRTERVLGHHIEFCAQAGATCLFEGHLRRLATGERLATFCGSVAFDRAARFGRYQAFLADLPAWMGMGSVADHADHADHAGGAAGLKAVERYLDLAGSGRHDDALDCFSPAIKYSCPASPSDDAPRERTSLQGKTALRELLSARDQRAFHHELVSAARAGSNWLVEGIAADSASGANASFMLSVGVDAHGLVDRYVGFYCDQPSKR